MAELNWSDAQWQKVNNCVTEAFGKASVASAFLPCYGPLAGSTETVRNERLKEEHSSESATIRLDDNHPLVNMKLVNLTVKVELSSEQVADETLSNAMFAFRRAADILAQEEDRIVFRGYDTVHGKSVFVANTVTPQPGLADANTHFEPIVLNAKPAKKTAKGVAAADIDAFGVNRTGVAVVSAVVQAINRLENGSNPGPFACVLGDTLFEAVQQPSFAFVLPSDRITPLLKGPLLRSGAIENKGAGIVVSLAGNAVDLVVGTPPTVQFLQRTTDAKFLFRVYERFVLRIRGTTITKYAGMMPTTSSPVTGFQL
jgi:uncharacterized linocin/CFP29 family protein